MAALVHHIYNVSSGVRFNLLFLLLFSVDLAFTLVSSGASPSEPSLSLTYLILWWFCTVFTARLMSYLLAPSFIGGSCVGSLRPERCFGASSIITSFIVLIRGSVSAACPSGAPRVYGRTEIFICRKQTEEWKRDVCQVWEVDESTSRTWASCVQNNRNRKGILFIQFSFWKEGVEARACLSFRVHSHLFLSPAAFTLLLTQEHWMLLTALRLRSPDFILLDNIIPVCFFRSLWN